MRCSIILLPQVAHEAKELTHVVIYPSLAEAVVFEALKRVLIIKGSHMACNAATKEETRQSA
jgi:hypothetical protein